MPLYTYQCSEHGLFEEINSIEDGAIEICPQCHKTAIRILSPVRIVSRRTKMGQTREELFQNLGKEGWADKDMWKGDKQFMEEQAHNALEGD